MSLLRLTNGFDRESDAKLIEKTRFILSQLSGNTHFPTPSPTLTEMTQALDAFSAAVLKASNGDRLLIAEKADKRAALVGMLHLLGYYVLFAAAGNRTVALTSGFTLAKEPSPAPELEKPTDLVVENGNQSGVLLVKVKTVKGAVAYVHQYSTDPELKEESWMSMTCTPSKCRLEDLTPGTLYYVRVGAIGTKDQVMYSDVISRIAA